TPVTSASSFPSLESLERIGFVNAFQALERSRSRLCRGPGRGCALSASMLSAHRLQRSDSMCPADLGHAFVHPSCSEISGQNAFVLGAHDRGHCLLAFLPVAVDLLRGSAASGCAQRFRGRYRPVPAYCSFDGGSGPSPTCTPG